MSWTQKHLQIYRNQCRYFNGQINGECGARVPYKRVELVKPPENGQEYPHYNYPCFKSHGCTERCPQASFLAEQEAQTKLSDFLHELQKFREELEKRG